ncbi:hypothetical protein GmHk_09G024479 [Glycine max]|nr:hypothetical protein GmHk_09G024479 [Glycine max]
MTQVYVTYGWAANVFKGKPSEDSEELFEINLKEPYLDTISEENFESSVFLSDIHINDKDVVHVAVDHVGESSMEALLWTLNHALTPSTTVYLLLVFPEIRLVPNNGNNIQVKVEIILTEGDNIAKTITDNVRDHSIRKLVIGITKSNLSKSVSRRRNAIADKALKNAPEICDIKIICDGKEVIDQMIGCNSSCSSDLTVPEHQKKMNPVVLFLLCVLCPILYGYLDQDFDH